MSPTLFAWFPGLEAFLVAQLEGWYHRLWDFFRREMDFVAEMLIVP